MIEALNNPTSGFSWGQRTEGYRVSRQFTIPFQRIEMPHSISFSEMDPEWLARAQAHTAKIIHMYLNSKNYVEWKNRPNHSIDARKKKI